jgi:ubiquinone/menaquinone biosynthesis C-methylase UbiE
MNARKSDDDRIKEAVRDHYGGIAQRVSEKAKKKRCCESLAVSPTCCEPAESTEIGRQESASSSAERETGASCDSASRLYTLEEIRDLPDSVTDISLGSGNPTAIAELRPGEVVLDLGSGGGIDCFLAAKVVGPKGRVIGIDMTPEMLELARKNAEEVDVKNVEFLHGEMEEIPLPDDSVDVIISNCVINLSPDKDSVFGEAYRVLRSGGRMVVSDIVTTGEIPGEIRNQLSAWAGCVAGALSDSDYLSKIRAAGFERVEVLSRGLDQQEECTESDAIRVDLGGAKRPKRELSQTVYSIKVRAYKP